MRLNYAIVFVSDMQKSVAFYRDLLGLPVGFESAHWTEFSTGGATLALHLGRAADNPVPAGDHAGTCRPGLSVPDLDSFHEQLIEQGATCLQKPRDVFGSRVAVYRDPDGLSISVGEDRAH